MESDASRLCSSLRKLLLAGDGVQRQLVATRSLRVTVVLASVLIPARLKCVTLVMLVFTACLPIILSRLQDDSS
eukprot:2212662-Amphidinium_carterae.1